MSEVMIKLENITKRFRQNVALQDIDLAINRGELFGVIGPDGAGKTTLLRIMAAVLAPSGYDENLLVAMIRVARHKVNGAGQLTRVLDAVHNPPQGGIRVNGVDGLQDPEQLKAQLGYMPQQFALYDDLSVIENLYFFADLFGVKGEIRQIRINELLAFARLQDFRKRRVKYLSGGMKKKLALACALLHRPTVLLLDEPTTGVDPVARREFWDLLSGLHTEGITTVVSTPYMDEAERCSRVALLYEGRLLACDTPVAIRSQVPGSVLSLTSLDARAARHALAGLPGLLDVQVYGDQLRLIIEGSVEAVQETIQHRLAEQQVVVEQLDRAPVRMEEAFIYLIGKAGGEVA